MCTLMISDLELFLLLTLEFSWCVLLLFGMMMSFLRSKISELRISFEFLVFDFRSWLTNIENTKWLHHISGLLKASLIVVNAIDKEHRCVLVHCSDGWDRTPQIVALAELMLDPFYRTLEVSW